MLELDLEFCRNNFALAIRSNVSLQGNVALIGESGSGKTSLLRVIAGLETATGIMRFREQTWLASDNGIAQSPEHRHLGFVFQDYALFSHMSVADNVAFGVAGDACESVVAYWLDKLSIAELAHRRPASLSGGQKQRVALARALASSPQCLLMDEPFAALDTSLKQQLRRDLKSLLDDTGVPLILATHDVSEAQYFCDNALILQNGKLIEQGSPAALLQNPANLEVARMMGWVNIVEFEQGAAQQTLPWGQLVGNEALNEYRACAVRTADINVCTGLKDGVEVQLIRIMHGQGQDLAEVEFEGGSRMQAVIDTATSFSCGDCLRVDVDTSKLVWLK